MVRRRDSFGTLDLLEWEPAQVAVGYDEQVAGRGDLDNKIARVVSRALRDAREERGLDRDAIAAAMATYLGRPLARATLDKWSSEASDGHRIPLDAFAALVHATGAHELLGFLPKLFGFAVVDEKYVEIVELHELEAHEADIQARKTALQAKMRGRR